MDTPGFRRHSQDIQDVQDVSPLTSQLRLGADSPGSVAIQENNEPTMFQADSQQFDRNEEEDLSGIRRDSKRDSRNDSTSTSATGPAGSGMPPAETAFTCEKEVVEDNEIEFLEMPRRRPRIRNTLLTLPLAESPRSVQSPRPKSALSHIGSLDARSIALEDLVSTASQQHRIRARLSSESSLDTTGSRHNLTEGDGSMIVQTAQAAKIRRPSLVHYRSSSAHPVLSGGNITGSSQSKMSASPFHIASRSNRSATESADKAGNDEVDQAAQIAQGADKIEAAVKPPSIALDIGSQSLGDADKRISLAEALQIQPKNPVNTLKRSTTAPSSVGVRRPTRYRSLPLSSNPPDTVIHENVIAKLPSETVPSIPEKRLIGEEAMDAKGQHEFRPYNFDITISARDRSSIITVSEFEEEKFVTRVWSKSKRNNDASLIRTAKEEYAHLVGKLRFMMGAKTPKAVKMRVMRSSRNEEIFKGDTFLISESSASLLKGDVWRLWADPSQGVQKREWLNYFICQSKTYGTSRYFILEILEGYDATRIVTAFASTTAISLIAMFLWLFLGVGGEGNAITLVDGVALQGNRMTDASRRAGDAFLFGVWVLFIGWTSLAGWVLAS